MRWPTKEQTIRQLASPPIPMITGELSARRTVTVSHLIYRLHTRDRREIAAALLPDISVLPMHWVAKPMDSRTQAMTHNG